MLLNDSSVGIVRQTGEADVVTHIQCTRSTVSKEELQLLLQLQGYPGFPKIIEHSESESSVTLESLPRTLLSEVTEHPEGLPRPVVRRWFRALVERVARVHQQGYIHGCLCLESALLGGAEEVTLGDFSLCRRYTPGQRSLQLCGGSLYYAAPEVLDLCACVGPEVDVWALGVCLFVLATTYFPFFAEPDLLSAAVRKPIRFPAALSADALLLDLIQRMLSVEPSSRASLRDVADHPWMRPSSFSFSSSSFSPADFPLSAPPSIATDSSPAAALSSRPGSGSSPPPPSLETHPAYCPPSISSEYPLSVSSRSHKHKKPKKPKKRNPKPAMRPGSSKAQGQPAPISQSRSHASKHKHPRSVRSSRSIPSSHALSSSPVLPSLPFIPPAENL